MAINVINVWPKKGSFEQVRIHWLLDLMEGLFKIEELSNFMHHLWTFDLQPGFEIMGNPGNIFKSNFKGMYAFQLHTWYSYGLLHKRPR